MGERTVTIGHDAFGNAIVTGDNNLTVVLIGVDTVPDELIAAIEFAEAERTQWKITGDGEGLADWRDPAFRGRPYGKAPAEHYFGADCGPV